MCEMLMRGLFVSFCTGLSDPYCEVSMGSQEHRTKVVPQTLNPKWNFPVSLAKQETFYCAFYLLCQRFRVSLPSCNHLSGPLRKLEFIFLQRVNVWGL